MNCESSSKVYKVLRDENIDKKKKKQKSSLSYTRNYLIIDPPIKHSQTNGVVGVGITLTILFAQRTARSVRSLYKPDFINKFNNVVRVIQQRPQSENKSV